MTESRISERSLIAHINKMGVTVTNYGVLGTNFTSRAASMEYPYGSGYQHLVRGGLWVGAVRPDSGFTGVTTATMDAAAGQIAYAGDEFVPAANAICRRSCDPNNPYYTPDAVSEMDYISEFVDYPSSVFTGNAEGHRSLGLHVTQYVYSWSAESYSHFVMLRYVIKNIGTAPLLNAWVGLYSELASGDMNAQTGAALWSGWFARKLLAYDPDLRMIREHFCFYQPVPANCFFQLVPYWAGVKLLTPPDTLAGQHVTLAAWSFDRSSPARDEDVERYAIMSAGTIVNTTADSLMPTTGDPVELLALGPFASIAAGDSITVEYALVGGAEPESIRTHASLAQRVRDLGYPSEIVATRSSLLSADAGSDGVHLRWDVVSDPGATALVERSDDGLAWQPLGELRPGASGMLEFVDHGAQPGARHAYRLGVRDGGLFEYTEPAWITVPLTNAFALHGARPNPAAAGAGTVGFALSEPGETLLECFDLLGRREASLDLGVLRAGEHVLPLTRLGVLRPAVHVLRLRQAGRVATARVVTLR